MDLEVPRSSRGGGTIEINMLLPVFRGRASQSANLGSVWEAPARKAPLSIRVRSHANAPATPAASPLRRPDHRQRHGERRIMLCPCAGLPIGTPLTPLRSRPGKGGKWRSLARPSRAPGRPQASSTMRRLCCGGKQIREAARVAALEPPRQEFFRGRPGCREGGGELRPGRRFHVRSYRSGDFLKIKHEDMYGSCDQAPLVRIHASTTGERMAVAWHRYSAGSK